MPAKRATIVQISDLHMNRKVDKSIIKMLNSIIVEVNPDILIVSGDLANQPFPWQMKRAARVVREIEQSARPSRTIVIPGNHDYKLWGSVGLRRLTRIPFEIYFRKSGLDHKWWWRVVESAKLSLNALWWKGTEMREPVQAHVLEERPELGVALFTINTNSLTEMMAAGKVESKDFQELYSKFDTVASRMHPTFDFYYKIAIVHHHPAPIADAPYDAFARFEESFMIFYNAGLFVRELSRRGFNLVLHGHKHVAGFLRISCEFKDHVRTVLPIAAAGTSTHPIPTDSRGHHLHVVEIFDDDTAKLKSRFFSATLEEREESNEYDLDTLVDVRRRRVELCQKLRSYSATEVRKTVEITNDGYSCVCVEYLGCRVSPLATLERIPLSLTIDRPSYLRGVKLAPGSSNYNRIDIEEERINAFKGEINLGIVRKPDDGKFDFSYCYRLINGHALTNEEFARHYGGEQMKFEFASITCEEACDLMTLGVSFPSQCDLSSLQFQGLAEYIPAPLKGLKDDRLDRGEGKRHDEETARIKNNIRMDANRCWLTCPNPIPGYIYKLCWTFNAKANELHELAPTAKVAELQRRLLAMAARASLDAAARTDWLSLRTVLDAIAFDVNQLVEGEPEKFHISAMVFDEAMQQLKFVCSNTEPEELSTGFFYSGEGCAGFAFEKARSLIYHPDRDPIGYFIGPREWVDQKRFLEPIVLASFPWIHIGGSQRQKLVIGVVNISSTNQTTKLLKLFDMPQAETAGIMKRTQDIIDLAMIQLL